MRNTFDAALNLVEGVDVRLSKRSRFIVITASAVIVCAVVGAIAWRGLDKADPDTRAATTDAGKLSTNATEVLGTIEGSEVNLASPWSARLDVKTVDGDTIHVVINRYTDLATPPSLRKAPDAQPGDAFPWAVLGWKLRATVQSVPVGFMNTKRELVAAGASITHP